MISKRTFKASMSVQSISELKIKPSIDMEKAKIYDFNVITAVNDKDGQKELDNDAVRFEFNDCFFTISQSKHVAGALTINKVGKLHPNTDQIEVLPHSANSITLK